MGKITEENAGSVISALEGKGQKLLAGFSNFSFQKLC